MNKRIDFKFINLSTYIISKTGWTPAPSSPCLSLPGNKTKSDLNTCESPEMRIIRSILHWTIMMLKGFVTQLQSLSRRAPRGWVTALKHSCRRCGEALKKYLYVLVRQQPGPWYFDPLSTFIYNTRQVHGKGAESGDQRGYGEYQMQRCILK